MILDADTLISKRKEKWAETHDLEQDTLYRNKVVSYMQRNEEARRIIKNQLQEHPEKMIELFFVIVNKEQETVPFFLNDV